MVSRNNPRYSILATIFALTLFGSGYLVGLTTSRAAAFSDASADAPPGVASTFGVFWQAWNLAEQHYVNRQALDPTKMTYGAVAGMLSALGDDGHTRFLSPAEVKSQQESLSGRIVGIGVQVSLNNGRTVVVRPFAGSPAQQAGLRSGDEIVAVDGQSVDGLSIAQVSTLIRGAAGTPVTLSTVHAGETTPVEVSVVRATVTVPSVSWAIVPGTQTAHVLVSKFSEQTTDELVRALTAARSAGATSLILDLRDDPGGIRDEAIGVASQFIASGNVLLERDAQGELQPYPVRPDGVAVDVPLAVLINVGSASSSEIVAGAIQDHQRGRLVGATTFGTGTVLSVYPLADGSAIYLGTAEWLTPNGRQIWHHGIVPDDAVALPASGRVLTPDDVRTLSASDFAASHDAQLLRAVQLVDPSYTTSAPTTTP